jgi:aconitate hydratase
VADPDAAYDQTLALDLGIVEPMAACPHSPGNVATVATLAGRRVHQVLIGSCTNSSYRDLKTVALLLRGKKIHPDVEVGVAPGSRQVVLMLAQEGLLTDLVAAGVRILENACGFCIGNHMSPGTDAVSLRTSNRNFEARSGTASAARATSAFIGRPRTSETMTASSHWKIVTRLLGVSPLST